MAVVLRIRRGSTTQWSSSTKVLLVGELGIDTTLNKVKAGNGTDTWANLPWLHTTPDDISTLLQSANEYTDEAITSLGNTVDGAYVPISDVGGLDGVAPLDSEGLIPDEYIPSTIARDSELFSGSYNDLSDKPSLFSGSYDDLSNKPTIPSLTGYATETYVETAISNLVDTAPETLNTLNELSEALGDDANFSTTISNSIGLKAPLESPTFTGTVSGITSTMVGLGNVDNTSDLNKPVSTDTQTALNAKLDSSGFTYASITIPVYSAIGDLPSAADNHGRWAHVHGEGAMYFAHGGAWYRALSETNLYLSTNSQGGSYTLATSDLDKMIEMSGGGTLTIIDSSSFPVGFTCNILQTGSSQVTIAGNGFTPNATPGLKLRTQWSSATLVKRSLNSWVVMGDLSA